MQRRQRPFLLAHDRRRVVGLHREPQTDLNRTLDNRREAVSWKKRELFVSPASSGAAPGLPADIVG